MNMKTFKITQYEKTLLELLESVGKLNLSTCRNSGEVWVSNFPNHGDSFKISDILKNCEVIDNVK